MKVRYKNRFCLYFKTAIVENRLICQKSFCQIAPHIKLIYDFYRISLLKLVYQNSLLYNLYLYNILLKNFIPKSSIYLAGFLKKIDGPVQWIPYKQKISLTEELEYFLDHLNSKKLKIADGQHWLDVVRILVRAVLLVKMLT